MIAFSLNFKVLSHRFHVGYSFECLSFLQARIHFFHMETPIFFFFNFFPMEILRCLFTFVNQFWNISWIIEIWRVIPACRRSSSSGRTSIWILMLQLRGAIRIRAWRSSKWKSRLTVTQELLLCLNWWEVEAEIVIVWCWQGCCELHILLFYVCTTGKNRFFCCGFCVEIHGWCIYPSWTMRSWSDLITIMCDTNTIVSRLNHTTKCILS